MCLFLDVVRSREKKCLKKNEAAIHSNVSKSNFTNKFFFICAILSSCFQSVIFSILFFNLFISLIQSTEQIQSSKFKETNVTLKLKQIITSNFFHV